MSTLYVKETRLRLALSAEDHRVLNQIRDDLRYRPNGYMFSPKFELWRLTAGKEGWDGYVCPMKRTGIHQAVLPRGYRDELLATARIHGIDVSGEFLPRPFEALTLADIRPDTVVASFLLDGFQRQAILAWLREVIGIAQMTVSGGKTVTFCAAAKIVKDRYPNTRFVYITPSERLVRQVTKEAKNFLPSFEIGQYGGGKHQKDAKDMVVCTVAVLHRNRVELDKEGWFKTFNAILFDEVHYCGSASAETVLGLMPAFWRFGASDTTKEDDPDRHSKMIGQFGSILTRVAATPHIESGRIARPFVYIDDLNQYTNRFRHLDFTAAVDTPATCLLDGQWQEGVYKGPVAKVDEEGQVETRRRFSVELDELGRVVKSTTEVAKTETGLHRILLGGEEVVVESRWVLLERVYDFAIVNFAERNERIVKWVRYYTGRGLTTLVVATRTLHIYILESLISKVVDPSLVRILFGWATPAQRDKAFDWFRNTPGSVLITPLVKVGVSINQIRAGVVADYVSDAEAANQLVGRFIRQKGEGEDNWAEITWFRDVQHPALRAGSAHVIRELVARGYDVFDSDAPDIDELLSGKTVSPAEAGSEAQSKIEFKKSRRGRRPDRT